MSGASTHPAGLDAVRAMLRDEYGLAGDLSSLPGENRNLLVTSPDGRRFVLKVASGDRPPDVLEFEHALVEHLAAATSSWSLPRTVRPRSGGVEVQWPDADGSPARGRLLAYVPGVAWCDAGQPSPAGLRDLGRVLATIDRALETFRHPAATRTHPWDLAAASQHRRHVPLIAPAHRQRLADLMFQRWAADAAPLLPMLPYSVIYGDANDENVLVDGDRVTGLLDFGDALRNPTVCELAIAIVYGVLDLPDPLAGGAELVAGYHAVRPLASLECEALFPLICGRLAASVTIAAERRRIDPGNRNWFVTEDRAWAMIERLALIDPAEGERTLTAKIDRSPDVPVAPPSREEILTRRRQHMSRALSLSYDEPLHITQGRGQFLIDDRGRPYLDLVNNVAHVGHSHPRVVEAGQRQMARLNTNTRYLHEALATYVERLTATLPRPLDVCFLVNSGSEANELALRLARSHTGRRDVLVVDGAYHGNTNALVAMSPYKFMGLGGTGTPEPWVHVVPMPDGYRGRHRGVTAESGQAYADDLGRVLDQSPAPVAAFFVESLLSCGGQIILPPGYLEAAFARVRAAGGVAVADEVQVGFGRVGEHFWGFELQRAVPDIVVMGKPIGNGHPMGAVVTTREIAGSFANGMEFFSTFGGNPVSCAIGTAVLDVIRDEGLQARASRVGAHFLERLRGLMARHAIVGDVRGAGLFIGVELVRSRDTLEPAAAEASRLVNRMMRRGFLLSTDGPLHNVIKIKPPLVIGEDDVDACVRALDEALAELKSLRS